MESLRNPEQSSHLRLNLDVDGREALGRVGRRFHISFQVSSAHASLSAAIPKTAGFVVIPRSAHTGGVMKDGRKSPAPCRIMTQGKSKIVKKT